MAFTRYLFTRTSSAYFLRNSNPLYSGYSFRYMGTSENDKKLLTEQDSTVKESSKNEDNLIKESYWLSKYNELKTWRDQEHRINLYKKGRQVILGYTERTEDEYQKGKDKFKGKLPFKLLWGITAGVFLWWLDKETNKRKTNYLTLTNIHERSSKQFLEDMTLLDEMESMRDKFVLNKQDVSKRNKLLQKNKLFLKRNTELRKELDTIQMGWLSGSLISHRDLLKKRLTLQETFLTVGRDLTLGLYYSDIKKEKAISIYENALTKIESAKHIQVTDFNARESISLWERLMGSDVNYLISDADTLNEFIERINELELDAHYFKGYASLGLRSIESYIEAVKDFDNAICIQKPKYYSARVASFSALGSLFLVLARNLNISECKKETLDKLQNLFDMELSQQFIETANSQGDYSRIKEIVTQFSSMDLASERDESILKHSLIDVAVRFYNEALELKPDHTPSLLWLSWICNEKGNHEQALEYISIAAKVSVDDPRVLIEHARTLLFKKDTKNALEISDKTIEILKDSTTRFWGNWAQRNAYYVRGMIFEEKNNKDESLYWLKKAHAIGKTAKWRHECCDRIERLEKEINNEKKIQTLHEAKLSKDSFQELQQNFNSLDIRVRSIENTWVMKYFSQLSQQSNDLERGSL